MSESFFDDNRRKIPLLWRDGINIKLSFYCSLTKTNHESIICLIIAGGSTGFSLSDGPSISFNNVFSCFSKDFYVNHLDLSSRYAKILIEISAGFGTFVEIFFSHIVDPQSKSQSSGLFFIDPWR